MRGVGIDEEIADVVSRQPQVTPQQGDGGILGDEAPVNPDMPLGDACLDTICLHCGEHQHRYHGRVARTQHASLGYQRRHNYYTSSPCSPRLENTASTV